jgi:hypothetical protein
MWAPASVSQARGPASPIDWQPSDWKEDGFERRSFGGIYKLLAASAAAGKAKTYLAAASKP